MKESDTTENNVGVNPKLKYFILCLVGAIAWITAVVPEVIDALTVTPEWREDTRTHEMGTGVIRIPLSGATNFKENEIATVRFTFTPKIVDREKGGKNFVLTVDGSLHGKASGATIMTPSGGHPFVLKELPDAVAAEISPAATPAVIERADVRDGKLHHFRGDRMSVGNTLSIVEIYSRVPEMLITHNAFSVIETFKIGPKPSPIRPNWLLIAALYAAPVVVGLWVLFFFKADRRFAWRGSRGPFTRMNPPRSSHRSPQARKPRNFKIPQRPKKSDTPTKP